MAAIVARISLFFHPALGGLSGEKTCQGINPWYFLIGIRMVTLFFAFGPCHSLQEDLICEWPSGIEDAKTFCSALCYNQHFPIPISSLWAFYLITIVFIVGLMKFVHVKEKDLSAKDAEAIVESEADCGNGEGFDPADLIAFVGWRYGIYIFCIVLILFLELSFIWVVVGFQLPMMNRAVVMCQPRNVACPPSAQCILNVESDKRTVLWALAFCAAANASFCVGYLAVFGAQACGCFGGCGNTGKAKPDCQGNHAREAVRHGCPCKKEGYNCWQDGSGGWMGSIGYRADGGTGMRGSRCHPEKLSCCHPQGSGTGRDGASGFQSNRQGPFPFQGNKAECSQNLMPYREDSEGKLLRGDTELVGERKIWRPEEGRIPVRDLLRGGAKKVRGSPGREGRVVRYVAKYHTHEKRDV